MPARTPAVIDIETSVIPDIGDYQEDLLRVPGRYRDPEKIAKWIEDAKEKQANFAALDVDLARIVAVCWTTDGKKLKGGIAKTLEEERVLLEKFWSHTWGKYTYIGFNILDFDLPVLVRRSQYLDVTYPDIELGRYRHAGSVDLMQILTWDGKVSPRSMNFYCKRFGITGPEDKHNGADVPGLVAMGDYESVKRHCAADVIKEWKLAERLGVIEQPVAQTDQPF